MLRRSESGIKPGSQNGKMKMTAKEVVSVLKKQITNSRQALAETGFKQQFACVCAPIGLDLGGSIPEEIAVAILAEVITVRRGGTGGLRSRQAKLTPE